MHLSSKFNIALIQSLVSQSVEDNLENIRDKISRAAFADAKIVILPEMFCCPYNNASFKANCEEKGGRIYSALSQMAKENEVFLVGGSIPEKDGEKLYNTCFVFNDVGECIATHRKVHLFDINVKNGQHFKESATFTAGNAITVVDTPFAKIGVCICFDIRFPEMFKAMVAQGVDVVAVPAAFNMTTGPLHWQLINRARAVDNQIYMLACAPARSDTGGYVSYAHSMAVDPWGSVVADAGIDEKVCIVELDSNLPTAVREQIPVGNLLRS